MPSYVIHSVDAGVACQQDLKHMNSLMVERCLVERSGAVLRRHIDVIRQMHICTTSMQSCRYAV